MCDYSYAEGGREVAMVTIARDETGKPTAWCDPCLVDTIKALNTNGLRTTASCCGHHNHAGWVMLEDGRTMMIWPNHDEALRASAATRGYRLSTHSDVNVSCNCDEEKRNG